MSNTITTWYGKDINKMTRRALVEAIKELGGMYTGAVKHHNEESVKSMNALIGLKKKLLNRNLIICVGSNITEDEK